VLLISISPIWLAMLLVLLFAGTLGWLQPGGFVPWSSNPLGAISSLVMPAMAVGLPLGGWFALALRDGVRKALADPWLDVATTMGRTRSAAVRAFVPREGIAHALHAVWLPLGLLVPAALVVENVFYLPGLGRLLLTALVERDPSTLQAALIALVALGALCRLLVQLLMAAADPRMAEGA
jgi:peptide/nickel transport system permease protein